MVGRRERERRELSLAWRQFQLSRSKLKAVTRNSALLAGFAIVAIVEIQLNNEEGNPCPFGLLLFYGVSTLSLIGVHFTALLISTCISPHVDAIAECEERDLRSLRDSPHQKMHFFVELSFYLSNVVGIIMFLVDLLAMLWVKFWELGSNEKEEGKKVAAASSLVTIIILVVFLSHYIYFYRHLRPQSKHQVSITLCQDNSDALMNEGIYSAFEMSSMREINFGQRLDTDSKPENVLRAVCVVPNSQDVQLNERVI